MTGFLITGDSGSQVRLRVTTVVRGRIVDLATTTTVFRGDSALSTVDSFYVGCSLRFKTGRLSDGGGEVRTCLAYVGSTKQFTVDEAYSAVPIDGDEFELIAPVNLTGKTIKLLFSLNGAAATIVTPTVISAVDGLLSHQFSAVQLAVDGILDLQIDYADDGGGTNKISTEIITLPVGRKLV